MHPKIYESFCSDSSRNPNYAQNCAILNSMLLRYVINEIFPDDNEYLNLPRWRVLITDSEHHASRPNYILDFGNTEVTSLAESGFWDDSPFICHQSTIRYCANHSDGDHIIQTLGHVDVTVWSEEEEDIVKIDDASALIAYFYLSDAVVACFPDCFFNLFRHPA